jgi:hypothetical protein
VFNPDNQPIDGIVLPETPHRNKLVLLPVELLLTPAVRIVSLHLRPDWKTGLVRIDCELNSACIGATGCAGCAVRSERRSLFRAAFENMAENHYAAAARIWPDRSWRGIVFSGGLVFKLPQLRQIIQDRFQTESRLCPVAEDALCGLPVLAKAFKGKALGCEGCYRAPGTLRRHTVRLGLSALSRQSADNCGLMSLAARTISPPNSRRRELGI